MFVYNFAASKFDKSSGAKYRVSFRHDNPDSMPSGTCQDWKNWHIPCKHFFTIFKQRAAWQWSNLPPSYLHSPYLSTDVEALKKHFDGAPVLNLSDDNDVHDAVAPYTICKIDIY